MKQVNEAQLKEVYDGLGMPYEPKEKSDKVETTQRDEGAESSSDESATTWRDESVESNLETNTSNKAE